MNRLWIYPLLGLLLGGAKALLLTRAEADLHHALEIAAFHGSVPDSRGVLSALLGTVVTAVAIILSITMSVMQSAAQQFTPRLVRNYLASPSTVVALTVFSGTVFYILLVLYLIGDAHTQGPAPRISVSWAMALVLLSIVAVVYQLHSTLDAVRIDRLLVHLREEAIASLENVPDPADRVERVPAVPDGAHPVTSEHDGVLAGVDVSSLVAWARTKGVRVQLAMGRGDVVAEGAPVAWVLADEAVDGAGLLRCLSVGSERDPRDDVTMGIRNLVDIAIRALSPAVNDPYTGVQVLDQLAPVLREVAHRRPGPTRHRDGDGKTRLVIPGLDFEGHLRLATDQMLLYGAGDPSVPRRLADLAADLAPTLGETERAALGRLLDRVAAAAEGEVVGMERARRCLEGDLRPDPDREPCL